MEGEQRRKKIRDILRSAAKPVSGSVLARELQVSRQVIVQDIALLRAADYQILSTTKGYMLITSEDRHAERIFAVSHTDAQMEEELNLIIDFGGKVRNVGVKHPIYGEILVELILSNRQDVKNFVQKLKDNRGTPLMQMGNGSHSHLVWADTEAILDSIEIELAKAGFLQ